MHNYDFFSLIIRLRTQICTVFKVSWRQLSVWFPFSFSLQTNGIEFKRDKHAKKITLILLQIKLNDRFFLLYNYVEVESEFLWHLLKIKTIKTEISSRQFSVLFMYLLSVKCISWLFELHLRSSKRRTHVTVLHEVSWYDMISFTLSRALCCLKPK